MISISLLIIFFQAREITSGERLISADFSPLEPMCAIMAVSKVIKNRLQLINFEVHFDTNSKAFFSERSERRKNDSKMWIPVINPRFLTGPYFWTISTTFSSKWFSSKWFSSGSECFSSRSFSSDGFSFNLGHNCPIKVY